MSEHMLDSVTRVHATTRRGGSFGSRLKRSRIAWIVGPTALALALALLGTATASTTGFFGGGDAGTQYAARAGAALPGGSSDTHEGVTATLTGVLADDSRTMIGISFTGRETEGAGVFPLGQGQIIGQDGRIYHETGGSSDQENLRLVTRTYPPLDPATRSFTLQINGITLLNRGVMPADGVKLNSQWNLRTDLPDGPIHGVDVPMDAQTRHVGLGGIVIDKVLQAPTGAVFTGHLVGFTMDQIPELGFIATLTGGDGKEQSIIGLRLGYGPNREQFEVRFPPTTGAATLRMLPTVSAQPHDPGAAGSLRAALEGATPAEWQVTLP